MTDLGAMARTAGKRLWRIETLPTLIRYVMAGGTATAVNFLVRIPLTEIFGFETAVIMSQAIGFCIGFLLYRKFVFTRAGTTLKHQVTAFGGVNLVAAIAVICVAISLHLLLVAAGVPDFHAEWLAHAAGLATGAPLTFSGHFLLTFRTKRA